MKREFVRKLLKDNGMPDDSVESVVKSIMEENGNDINSEKIKAEGYENDLKVKEGLIESLNTKIKELGNVDIDAIKQEQFELGKQDGLKEVDDYRKNEALKKSIKGAKDFDLVFSKLDKEKIKYEKNEKGEYSVTGIDEQIKSIKENYSYLFNENNDSFIDLGGNHGDNKVPDFQNMPYDEYKKYREKEGI